MHTLDYDKWNTNWPLTKLNKILFPIDASENRLTINPEIQKARNIIPIMDLTAFKFIFLYTILRRIDLNSSNIVRSDFTPYSIIESLERGGDLTQLVCDVVSFILFSRMYMDKLAKLLHAFTYNGASDNRYKKWIDKANEFENRELANIILNSKDWFTKLRDVRTDKIVHRAFLDGGVQMGPKLAVTLHSYKDMKTTSVSLQDVQNFSDNMFSLTKQISDFFIINSESIPIRL